MDEVARRRCTTTRARVARALAATVVVAGAAVPALGTSPAGAETAEGFRNGEAEAAAQTFSVNVTQGNANIGFTYGQSLANYRDTTGTADAKALDLGVLPTLFGVEQCDGSAPILNPATFPPQTRVDSTDPAAPTPRPAAAHQPGLGTRPAGPLAGEQDATATRLPSSRSTTRSERADMYVLAVDGGTTEVTTQLRDGVREARAVSTASQLRVFGGLFTFVNPRWEATARSGATTTAEGSFTFERATVLGSPRTPEQAMRDLEGFRRGLEQLLAPFGVELQLPTVEIDGGRVEVTPMGFVLADMPWGAQVIAPFLGDIQPLKEVLTRQLLEEDCRNESSLLMLDVILGVLGGSGSVQLHAGGVEVATADTDFSSPPLPELPVDVAGAPPAEVADQSLGLDEFAIDDLAFDDLAFDELALDGFDATVTDLPTAEPVEAAEPEAEEVATTTAALVPSRFEDSDSGAAAAAVGALALTAALALSFGERWRARRTSRRIP